MKKVTKLMLIFLSLILYGCSKKSNFELVKREENGVVFYFADQKQRNDEPVIVLCHGLGEDHQDMETAAELIYKRGYAVVTLDLYGHENIAYSSDILIDEIIEKSADKISNILQILESKRLCEADQFGIYGYSIGGMIGFYLASYGNASPKILIAMASLPNFEVVLENTETHMALKFNAATKRFEQTSPEENQRLQEWMSTYNPVNQLERLKNTAIFMVNGAEDSFMPIEHAEEFQEEFTKAGGLIQLYVNPNGTHSELGDYHVKSILKSAESILSPVEKQ